MTEGQAQHEADRLERTTGTKVALIGCDDPKCLWRVIVTGDPSPREAVRVVVALGGTAHVNGEGRIVSRCAAHPETHALPAVIAP